MMHIRPTTIEDYPALCEIRDAIMPDNPAVVADFVEQDAAFARAPQCHFARWVGEIEGRVMASGLVSQSPWNYEPDRYRVRFFVHPDYQGRGYGKAFYAHLRSTLQSRHPKEIDSHSREDLPRGMRFLQDRGFVEHHRNRESWLTLADFDMSRFADFRARFQGIIIKSYAELPPDERDRKLYELDMATSPDVPNQEDFTPVSFEQWHADIIAHETFLPEGFLVALDGEQVVGMSNVLADRATNRLITDYTCVRREYRRRGIALALKLAIIDYAQTTGKSALVTTNDTDNTGMLAINERLGFQPRPAWVYYRKAL